MTLSFGGGAGVLTIPGVASDGHDGLVVAETLTAGDIHANGNAVPNFHELYGSTSIEDAVGNNPDGDLVLAVAQSQGQSADMTAPTMEIIRQGALNGHLCAPPVLTVADAHGTGVVVAQFVGSAGGIVGIGQAGGIGLFGHAPPSTAASITGALSTVTDAAAKAVLTAIIAALVGDGGATNNTT